MAPTSTHSRTITLDDLTHQNIGVLKKLNTVLFPVPYSEKFYKESLTVGELAKLGNPQPPSISLEIELFCRGFGQRLMIAYFRDVCVGAVRCQYEPPSDDAANPCEGRIYIMTLGVLAPYRRYGIGTHPPNSPLYLTVLIAGLGTKLLDHVLSVAETQTRGTPGSPVKSLYLHVQTTNQEAVDWYTKRGFTIERTVEGYYRNIEDVDAYILVRKLE
jgi:ribosomal protein S18 acetylase RimI-like enzyme